MNAIPNKFLPIGTVVLLKGAKKRLMISGFAVTSKEDNKMWDYCGCAYPEGIMTLENISLFDHEQIEKIFHMGLSDDEEENFKKSLNEYVNNPEAFNNKNN